MEPGRICNFATLEQSMKHNFYFNPSKNCCAPFDYLGCSGNENNFFSAGRCIQTCLDEEYDDENDEDPVDTDTAPQSKSDCFLKPEMGPCRALIGMWFYNSSLAQCDLFSYGGCQGNGNRFDGEDECNEFCEGVENEKKEMNKLPEKKGVCSS
jgi:hypothetical protein